MLEEKYARNHIQIVNSIRQAKKISYCGFDTTSNSQLSEQQTHLRIGVKFSNPEESSKSQEQMSEQQNAKEIEIQLTWPHGLEPGKKIDWHQYDINGKLWDFTSSVKNQYECQSCGSFAIIASMESNFIIQARQKMNIDDFIEYGYDVVKTVDLSEWQLYIDSLINFKGKNPNQSELSCIITMVMPEIERDLLNVAINEGVYFDVHHPYKPREVDVHFTKIGKERMPDMPCFPAEPINITLNEIDQKKDQLRPKIPYDAILKKVRIRQNPLMRYNENGTIVTKQYPYGIKITTLERLKDWLFNEGPVVGIIPVKNDFVNYYDDGVYTDISWTPDEKSGLTKEISDYLNKYLLGTAGESLHAICIVGYNDAPEIKEIPPYFICKNSWGRCWGKCGWFQIDQKYLCVEDLGKKQSSTYLRYPAFITQVEDHDMPIKCNMGNISPCEAYYMDDKFETYLEMVRSGRMIISDREDEAQSGPIQEQQ